MNDDVKYHLERLKAATLDRHTLEEIPEWLCANTYINGKPFSFVDHEYQERIARDQSVEKVIRKCSQIGISELSARIALAMCNMQRGFTCIYTLPTAHFAATFMRSRIDPVIASSPYMKSSIATAHDNSEVKAFGTSFLYVKGSQSSNAPISIPANMLIHDELDFSDPDVISQYQSRLTHSKVKRKIKLSTPTLPERGIDKEFSRSRRHFNFVKCNHCNHWFVPDYYKHVRVPGFSGELKEITKANLHSVKYNEAKVECPKCGGVPSLQPEFREWVCENEDEGFIAAGYQISPFDAPNIITPGYLIEASTQYRRIVDFQNFNLGLPAEDQESILLRSEMEACLTDDDVGGYSFVIGLDLGMICWLTVASVASDQRLVVVHTEGVPLHRLRGRYKELARQYRVRVSVSDALPYTETVWAMQQGDLNLYSAIFTRSKGVETFTLKKRDEEAKDGVADLRQININRDRAMDHLMDSIRTGMIMKRRDENDELWIKHCMSMSRVKQWTPDAEMSFVWRKPEDGEDHLWHSLLYVHIASQILGVSRNTGIWLPPILGSFKVTT